MSEAANPGANLVWQHEIMLAVAERGREWLSYQELPWPEDAPGLKQRREQYDEATEKYVAALATFAGLPGCSTCAGCGKFAKIEGHGGVKGAVGPFPLCGDCF